MAEQKNLPVSADATTGEFLQKFGQTLKEYAVRDYNQTAFLRSAMIAIADNHTLAECLKTDAGKKSLFNVLRYAAATGLSLNPQEGKAAIIGYKNKAGETVLSYQIMKNGMLDIALESGKVEFITADLVRENDKFSIRKSASGDDYDYQPAIRDRGAVIGFIAALKLRGGPTYVKWMTVEEVCEFRDKYSSMYKFQKDNSAWEKSFNGMGVKTVLKALLRNISISDALDNAIGTDDFFEADFQTKQTPGVSADAVSEKLDEKKPATKSEPESLL